MKPQAREKIDFMFHFWGEAFLCALDNATLGEVRLKRWQKIIGTALINGLYSDAIYAARKFRELPEPTVEEETMQ